jgi:hypothetical protein
MRVCAGLRVEGEVAQVLVVSQPPPVALLVFLLSGWREACATSAAGGGGEGDRTIATHEPSACVPRSFHQAGQKVVASFGQTVAFCQVICKRIKEPEFRRRTPSPNIS